MEQYKQIVLKMEPEKVRTMGPIPVMNRFWRDVIYDRFIRGIAVYFVRVNGRLQPREMARDEYWQYSQRMETPPAGPLAEESQGAMFGGGA